MAMEATLAHRLNNAIKVMRYTRRFWYGVRCALLVQWGTPYCRRYMLSLFKVSGFGNCCFSHGPSGDRNADKIVHRKCG